MTVMKKVITYGTFDLLHYGHINLLKRAKVLGDYLIVALSSNKFNAIKDKRSFFNFEERETILESIKDVDEVIMEDTCEQNITVIKKYNIDIFVIDKANLIS